jgi:hypothetical protein
MKKQIKRPAVKETWTEQHRLLCHLLEEEVHGLMHYLRALHFLAVGLIIAAGGTLIYGLSALFQNTQHAVVAFLMLVVTAALVMLLSIAALRPWILPRFLLPTDMGDLRYDEMLETLRSPREYISLLKNHVQHISERYLSKKLARLREAIFVLVFGIAVASILAIALP